MNVIPIFTCDRTIVGPHGTTDYVSEEASFDPIPASDRPGPGESHWFYSGCEDPRYWAKVPPLSRIVAGQDGKKCLHAGGEPISAKFAWVVLWLARQGRQGFRLDGPPAIAASPSAGPEVSIESMRGEIRRVMEAKAKEVVDRFLRGELPVRFEIYGAPRRVYYRGRQVNAWEEMSFEPIPACVVDDGDDRRVQEAATSPAYAVLAPQGAELLGGKVVKLRPTDVPPYFSPERLVSNARAGRFGLAMALGSADPEARRPAPKEAIVMKPDGMAAKDLPGQATFAWAS